MHTCYTTPTAEAPEAATVYTIDATNFLLWTLNCCFVYVERSTSTASFTRQGDLWIWCDPCLHNRIVS